ncbi:enoyl-CoA hydratase/isomerase family protein [Actinoallomurus purpureus]|uniref:enoyl-CoA hydratase/isomerase family protein n=1 Tax=Actinoallomurus purpureus TaxID=478114 RepID=UPI00209320CE|nr:enoyl-CoA hydratase/isomerase family protein [Actinoallomurus purpureus]MCO6006999.1 enoyl-CoA hydratase/isomerase family protein [Actinoallomurus purpureus]
MPHLTYSIDDGLAMLVLNNPPQNRIDPQMATEFAQALEAIGRSSARAVLVRSEGPDFSFGGDVVDWPDADVRGLRTLFERYMQVFNQLERLPLPVIAAVHGLCFGGGLELAFRADNALLEEATAFARKTAKGPTRAYAAHKALLRRRTRLLPLPRLRW